MPGPQLYRDTATGAIYVLVGRDRKGVYLRDLDSTPGDPMGVTTLGEWAFWLALDQRQLERVPL
ncbi:hypothetical protein [Acidiferrobacter thiooxydans]|uniref:Uncharacterized protein n=1 Tax=Acidiferrobacter thiooxydans TaxID=163359 RepID=A0A368HI87_9GAMM|nr:hypothetical protein [Acidiferrobacter thiooxydans]RCN59101.1 hypothetical protein C4900_05065 [Acidiferrobacter thiooxydans]